MPIAGLGQRMLDGGFEVPKPMLVCGNKSILEWSMASIDYSECNLVFVVREEHVKAFGIDAWLLQKWPDAKIERTNGSSGAADTARQGIHLFSDKSLPLIVYCPDVYFEPIYKPSPEDFTDEGMILTFKANSTNYSYVLMSSLRPDEVCMTIEKQIPASSNLASVGVYCFKSTGFFNKYALKYLIDSKKEHHIAPLYNTIINNPYDHAGIIRQRTIDKVHIMGTPSEFKFFEEVSYKYFLERKFALCCDHSGFALKENIKKLFDEQKVGYVDFGCYNDKDCDYNTYVKRAAEHVLKNKEYFGLACCRSGQGVNICANKIAGIRSALISDEYHAEHAIRHNAANFFALSAIDFQIDGGRLYRTAYILKNETFDGGRHQNRMMKNGI